jgi:hypothetical protein
MVAYALALAAGCSGSGSGAGTATATDPLYAMMVQVYTPDDRNVYVVLTDSVDVTSISLEDAREFPGVANFAPIGGRLLVSDGGEPKITEFSIDDAHQWSEGRTVSFAQYPLSGNANFYYQFIVDEHTAVLPYDGTKRIIWDPATMAITGSLDDTALVARETGLVLEAGGNRNSVHYDASVMQTFYYHDEDWFDYGSQSHVAFYDPNTQREQGIIDVPCPGLSLATRDEAGNTYFSNWGLPTPSLTGQRPATCVAKVGPDHSLVAAIDPRTFTQGRVVSNFRYIGGGRAFGNVLHHEALGVASPADLDADALADLWMSGPHWRLWLFDLNQQTARPVEGIDVAMGDGAQFAVLEGRTFIFLPYDDWGRTRVYELASDGTATMRFDTVGDIFKWVRVR